MSSFWKELPSRGWRLRASAGADLNFSNGPHLGLTRAMAGVILAFADAVFASDSAAASWSYISRALARHVYSLPSAFSSSTRKVIPPA